MLSAKNEFLTRQQTAAVGPDIFPIKSVRFRPSVSARLTRTFATPTSAGVFTFSCWFKRGTLGSVQSLFGASTNTFLGFNASDQLVLTIAGVATITSTQFFRDPSSWYYVIYVQTGGNATLYYQGISATAAVASTVINTAISHIIGASNTTTPANFFDGYMTSITFVDGTATASVGGQIDDDGYLAYPRALQPAAVTYGNNGFYLDFGVSTSLVTLGADTSGLSHNWTAVGFGITVGTKTTYDSMRDVPTNYANPAANSNYATLQPLQINSGYLTVNTSWGNLSWVPATQNSSAFKASTIGFNGKGKWYWECQKLGTGDFMFGIASDSFVQFNADAHNVTAATGRIYGVYFATSGTTATLWNGTAGATVISSWTDASDTLGIAFDAATGSLWMSKNGTWFSGNPDSGTSPSYTGIVVSGQSWVPYIRGGGAGATNAQYVNFGQQGFLYTTGNTLFNPVCAGYTKPFLSYAGTYPYLWTTTNTYTGNGASTVYNLSPILPSVIWGKSLGANTQPASVKNVGDGVYNYLAINSTAAYNTSVTGIIAAQAGSAGAYSYWIGTDAVANQNTFQYRIWSWVQGDAATGSQTTDASGTIAILRQTGQGTPYYTGGIIAGSNSGYYIGTGAIGTIAHGLGEPDVIPSTSLSTGATPAFIIIKSTSSVADWFVWHRSLTASQYLVFNTTAIPATSATALNATLPGTSFVTVGASTLTNTSGATYEMMSFAQIRGYSKFAQYTGSGQASGYFVWTGFTPRFVMIKCTSAVGDWYMISNNGLASTYLAYGLSNPITSSVTLDTTAAESTTNLVDFVANGFKIRTSTLINVLNATYIFCAWAEVPFEYSNAR